jgi:DNA repair protein RadD
MQKELRPYQEECLQAIRETVSQRVYRLVVQAPTGSGKTLVAATIVEGALRKGNKMTFVVPAISLIDQAVEMFWNEGIRDIGVIQADHILTDWSKPVQVASIQTIRSRGKYPEAQVVAIDECHQLHKEHVKWMKDPAWEKVPFIGLSATPWTKGLGKYFDSLLVMSTTRELIELGFLSKFRVFAADHPDLSGVKVLNTGDYHEGQLAEVMNENKLVANVIETWKTRWGKDKTMVFGVDCAHAQALQARFLDAGISCAYQDAHTTSAERAAIKRGFHNGEYRVVCNVATLTTGVDWDVRCLVLARPTKSEMLFVQIVGRCLRTAEGKEHALIFDHTDTTSRLGFVTDIHHDELHMGKLDSNKSAKRAAPLPKPCPECDFMMSPGTKKCPECGHEIKIVSRVFERDGQLVEYDGSIRRPPEKRLLPYTYEEKARFYAQLRGYGISKDYNPKWAAIKFLEKFEHWPPFGWNNHHPMAPGPEVMQYIRHRNISWARSPDNPNRRQKIPPAEAGG